jgi:hypothetical protein
MEKNENRSVVDMHGHTQHLQRGWKWMDRRENKKKEKETDTYVDEQIRLGS